MRGRQAKAVAISDFEAGNFRVGPQSPRRAFASAGLCPSLDDGTAVYSVGASARGQAYRQTTGE